MIRLLNRLLFLFNPGRIIRRFHRERPALPLSWRIPLAMVIIIHFPILAQIRIHKNLTVDDGLVQSQVNCILEDRQGYLWFGTLGGISRWDGINFVNFQTQDGLSSPDIRTIHQSRDGSIYFGTNGGGVTIYRDGKFSCLTVKDGLANNTVRAIHESEDGTIYFGTDGGLTLFKNGKIDSVNIPSLLKNAFITSIASEENGILYFGVLGKGVIIYKRQVIEILNKEKGLVSNRVRAVYKSKNGSLYISMIKQGVSVYNNGRIKTFISPDKPGHNNTRSIFEDREGNIYFATLGGGVNIFKNGRLETIDESNGLAHNSAWSTYEDKNGVLYFATWGGVSIFRKDKFITLNQKCGLPKDNVNTIFEGAGRSIYVGMQKSGIWVYNEGLLKPLTSSQKWQTLSVWSMYRRSNDVLYIGLKNGAAVYENGNIRKLISTGNQLKNNVYDILETQEGVMYFGTYNGIFVEKNGILRLLYEETDSRRRIIFSICQKRSGEIFFGTRRGLVIYKDGQVDVSNQRFGLSEEHIWVIHESSNGTMYFGTNGNGLRVWKDGNLNTIDASDGLSDNTIYGILEDDAGRLYLSTNRGINILDFSGDAVKIRYLRHSDGLGSEECNQGAYFQDRQGRFWFGTINSVSCYNPQQDLPIKKPPDVYMTRIRLFEEDLPVSSFSAGRQLKYNENYLKFDYIGLYLPAPNSVVYRYRLSGIDDDWVETMQRFVQYTSLGHGDYTFKVKAKNEWGYWSEPIQLSFTILPPYWKTWWFIALVILGTSGTIVFFVTYRVKQILAIERLRTKIAADLHDDIGSGLTEISIMSEVINQKLSAGTRKQIVSELEKISGISRGLIDSMSDIVWLVNPRRDSLYDLVSRLGNIYTELLNARGVHLKTENLELLKNVQLNMEFRQHLFLIFKEALNNSLKYSNASEIFLNASLRAKRIRVQLIDNGRGFDTREPASGNGLKNMKARAERIGGALLIKSEVGKGTTIEFEGSIT